MNAVVKDLVSKKLTPLWADKRTYKKRLELAFFAALAACFTFVFYGPLEMIVSGSASLIYNWRDVVWLLLGAFAVSCAALTFALPLLRGKIFNWAVSLVFAATAAGYLQGMFWNGTLGALTGDGIDWPQLKTELWQGLFAWAIVFVAVFLLLYLKRKWWRKAVCYVCILLVAMQAVPTVGIFCGLYDTAGNNNGINLTTQGMYQYSQKDNIFVFVLDRMDMDYVNQVLKKDPAFFDALDGFTAYDNAISAFARTKPALLQLLTGTEEGAYTTSYTDFYTDAWTADGKNILRDLDGAGYSVELYTELRYLFSDMDCCTKYVDNASRGLGELQAGIALEKFAQLSLYRYAPLALKPFFWSDTNYYNSDVFDATGPKAYAFDDYGHSAGFITAKANRSKSAFKLYHFTGPHAPYVLNADGTKNTEKNTSAREQLMGCMTILYNAMNRMKLEGIYEDATIIITADHGRAMDDTKPVQKETRIGLFYKPSGSAGTPLQWSSAPVCTDNLPATILKAAGADYSRYGTPLDEIPEDADIVRYYYKTAVVKELRREAILYTYEVVGDASDFKNWHLIREDEIPYGYN